jgi:hypothetical protein
MQKNKGLWFAVASMFLIGTLYGLVVLMVRGVPGASGFIGHTLGILGFILMILTELLYSLRKRSRTAYWGRMSDWLEFHIYTGIVGPFLVLLHSSWKFQGLAGAVMLMTGLIVLSGFVGRYIYTAVPRSVEGIELQNNELEQRIMDLDTEIRRKQATVKVGENLNQESLQEVKKIKNELEKLMRQVGSLSRMRKLLAIWHLVHIPLGVALFTSAFIHIGAAIYYSTLLH